MQALYLSPDTAMHCGVTGSWKEQEKNRCQILTKQGAGQDKRGLPGKVISELSFDTDHQVKGENNIRAEEDKETGESSRDQELFSTAQ